MLLIRLFHLLTGYIRFFASGGFPERFVNLCAGMRIPVWDLRPTADGLSGSAKIPAYRALRHAARRSGMRLRIRGKHGMPFFLRRHRTRFGLVIGMGICASILCVLSVHLWVIDVDSPDAWTRACVRQALYNAGVREGMRMSQIDASYTERTILLHLPQTEWIALNVQGSVLHVELRDAAVMPPQADYTQPCHIVAAKDGFLTRLETYEGTRMATLRTAVQKGQLLISGVTEHTNGTVTLQHAKGYAQAQTTRHIRVQMNRKQTYRTVDHIRVRTQPALFFLRIPLGDPRPAANAQYFCYVQTATAGDMRLPITCTVFRNLFYGVSRTLSPGQIKLLLLSDFGQKAAAELRECAILHAGVRLQRNACTGTFRLLENIGVEQEILTEFEDS